MFRKWYVDIACLLAAIRNSLGNNIINLKYKWKTRMIKNSDQEKQEKAQQDVEQ